jgi:hypothetical protein
VENECEELGCQELIVSNSPLCFDYTGMNELEYRWFNFWNRKLWEARANNDIDAEAQAIAFLYCKPSI